MATLDLTLTLTGARTKNGPRKAASRICRHTLLLDDIFGAENEGISMKNPETLAIRKKEY